jgi:hypothetical protein
MFSRPITGQLIYPFGLGARRILGIMVNSNPPPLKPLHADSSLIESKLDKYGKLSDQELIDSLKPGQPGSLKVWSDATIVDGHHRIKVLRDRGVDVDSLPREIIPKDAIADPP